MNSESKIWALDVKAANDADKALWARFPELKSRKLTFDVADGKYRKHWMDLYEKFGGCSFKVGKTGIRIGRIALKDKASVDAARRADEDLWSRFPELNRRRLSVSDPTDGVYRKAWMDLFLQNGGSASEVGESGVRIPIAS